MDYFDSLFEHFTNNPAGLYGKQEIEADEKEASHTVTNPISEELEKTPDPVPSLAEPQSTETAPPDRFEDDIRALAEHFGSLTRGQKYTISLQEILSVCPRTRKRKDTYNSLVKRLEADGIELIITTTRSK